MGVGRVLGTLPNLICQVETTLGPPRKDGRAPVRGGVPAMGIKPLLQPSRRVSMQAYARGNRFLPLPPATVGLTSAEDPRCPFYRWETEVCRGEVS